jgi:flagellar motor switch protein FliM
MLGLRVGDIITTEKDIHEPLDVLVQGVTKFRAKPGAHKGRKAIEIAQTIAAVAGATTPAAAPPAANPPTAAPNGGSGKKK